MAVAIAAVDRVRKLRRETPLAGVSGLSVTSKTHSVLLVQVCGDVRRVVIGNPHIRHGRAGRDTLRILNPVLQVRRRIRQPARNHLAFSQVVERRANLSIGAWYARYGVASSATVVNDGLFAPTGITTGH